MNWKRMLVVYGIVLVIVSLSLIMAPSYASEADTVVYVETLDQVWQRAEENTIKFNCNPLLKGLITYRIRINYHWNISETIDRTHIIIYKIFSNGIYVDRIRHTIRNLGGCREYGDYGTITIPSETLKVGENTVMVLMTFNSTASETPSKPDIFHFIVKEIVVKTDNSKLAAVLTLMFIPFGIILGYERERSWPRYP